MNVKLAVQVLSSSVADAIDYLRSIGHPRLAGSEATVPCESITLYLQLQCFELRTSIRFLFSCYMILHS